MVASRTSKPEKAPPVRKAAVLNLDRASLPRDPDALITAFEELKTFALGLCDKLDEAEANQALLMHRLNRALRAQFGPSSERSGLLGGPGQALLPFLEAEISKAPSPSSSASPSPVETPAKPRPAHPGRRPLPPHLKRVPKLIDVPVADRVCLCCKKPMQKIGEDTASRLEYEPSSLFVIDEVRPKYACPACKDGVLSAEPTPAAIARGLPGPGLLAHVVVQKYADHLPLHRQEWIFARLGVELSRSTLCDWIAAVADMLEPIWQRLSREILASAVIAADETKCPVQDRGPDKNGKKRRKTRTAWLWAFLGDEAHPATVFVYSPSRGSECPLRFLAGFKGKLVTDDYAGYNACYGAGAIECGCWAHVRRGFFDARATDPPRCDWMIEAIRRLYAIEDEARDLAPDARAALRRARAGPILEEIRAWLDTEALSALPKSAIGEAIAYARNRWLALVRYVDDGRVPIDNNRTERAIRDIVIGRKNWLFAGSDDGGRRAAIIFSVIATCKQNGVEPWAYLRDVLERLPTFRGDIGELLPAAWKRTREAKAKATAATSGASDAGPGAGSAPL